MRYLLLAIFLISSISINAQKEERTFIRRGNRQFKDSTFTKAEIYYRKALNVNSSSTEGLYNLGNALQMQQKGKDAMKQYITALNTTKDKKKLAKIYHNIGVIWQANKQYQESIEAYKKALHNNPEDKETRNNLALAKKMLKNKKQNKNNNQNQKKNKDKDKDNKDQQNNKQQNQQNNKQQQQKQNQNQMSKENAEQLLNAVMQDEQNVQNKIKKQMQLKGKKLEKDW